jgi:hypothetical protein
MFSLFTPEQLEAIRSPAKMAGKIDILHVAASQLCADVCDASISSSMASVFPSVKEEDNLGRISKRMSITRLPSVIGGFTLDSGSYKLYISESDRAKPFSLRQAAFDRLYEYQREGVRWLWERYCVREGGLLGTTWAWARRSRSSLSSTGCSTRNG